MENKLTQEQKEQMIKELKIIQQKIKNLEELVDRYEKRIEMDKNVHLETEGQKDEK